MKFKKLFLILLTTVFLLQTLPLSALAEEDFVKTSALSVLNAATAKHGDIFIFKVLDDLNLDNKIVISNGSIIEGKVIKVKKPLLLRTDAFVDVLITSIKSDSSFVNLEKDEIKLRITDTRYKTLEKRVLQRTPVVVASTATSIALGTATSFSGGIIFAIAVGAAATGGFISGWIDPDIGCTRLKGAFVRCAEGTPAGTFFITTQKGYNVSCTENSSVAIRFDRKTRQRLASAIEKSSMSSR